MRKDFYITLAGSFIILLFNVVSGIITARALGPSGKGILRTMIIWPTLLSQIGLLGMQESYIYLKNKEYDPLKLKSSILSGVLISSILISLPLYFIYALFFKSIVKSLYIPLLIALYVPIANTIYIGLSFLQERMAFFKYNLLRLLLPSFYIVLLLIDYNSLTPEKCFVYLFISNIILFFAILPEFIKLKLKYVSLKYLKDSLGFGIKTQLSSIIGSVSQQADQAILSVISTPKILGIYSVAVSISRIGTLAPYAAQIVLYPRMAREKKYNIRKNIIFLFLINLFLYIILFAILRSLIRIFYGPMFEGATTIAYVLFLVSFPLSVIYVGNAYFKSKGQPIKTTLVQSIIFILLFILTPLFYILIGILGVAYAIVIAYSIGALYYIINFKRNRDDI